jgi:hypothetical protein
MEIPPADIHGEFVDLEVHPPGMAPGPLSEVDAGPAASPGAPVEVDDLALPDEGVYAPPRPRRILSSEIVEFRTATLARRRPRITGDDSFLAAIDDA